MKSGVSTLDLVLIVLALVAFFVASFFSPPAERPYLGRWNLVAVGLFLVTLTLLI